jgi:hypothetical protein
MISKYNKFLKEKQMRDILNLLDNLLFEENMQATKAPWKGKNSGVINPKTGKPYPRGEMFLIKVKTGSPFTLVKGGEVVVDPKEAKAVAAWLATGPVGVITMRTTDGGVVKNTEIQKTIELGSKESENLPIKPSDVFTTDETQEIDDFGNNIEDILKSGGFPASEMYSKIAGNPNLVKLGKLGDAVIYMARQANEGKIPVFPGDLNKDQTKAIELYASEYIGALALVTGAAPFIRGSREQFEEFVGGNLADMIMFFPKATNNPLADSFSVVNNATGHAVKISSKAAGKGAPPSLGSMKFPEEIRNKYPEATEFLDAAQDPGVSSFTQPFALMNYLYEIDPAKIPKAYQSIMPFSPELVAQIENSNKTGKALPRKIMGLFEKQLSAKVRDGTATDGGKAWWATIQDMMRLVNNDRIIPDFRAALIESLGYNFVQLYTKVKGNKLVTEAFWPAKISGQVKLKTKGSAGEQKGKMSVEISPGGEDLDSPSGQSREEAGTLDTQTSTGPRPEANIDTTDLDTFAHKRTDLKAADTVENPKRFSKKATGRDYQR